MKRLWLSIVLLAGACTPPAADNQSAGNTSSDAMSAAAQRSATPPADDAEPPKTLPLPETVPVPSAAAKAAEPAYTARGQEPGWALTMAGGRIDYEGNYGDKRIQVAAPLPISTANGRRYVTPRLTIEIAHARCNDAMSGQGFEDKVKVTADGETYEGCGGKRRSAWDM